MKLYAFRQLYIADLNAIQKRGNHYVAIANILSAYPNLDIWLDCGIGCIEHLAIWQDLHINFVIGSESLKSVGDYLILRQGDKHILSMDFGSQGYSGPAQLLEQAELWPDKVIAMTLSQVGSQSGPDMATLHRLRSQSGKRKIYAAGGVRSAEDLLALKHVGISGALVATALHSGAITGRDIAHVMAA